MSVTFATETPSSSATEPDTRLVAAPLVMSKSPVRRSQLVPSAAALPLKVWLNGSAVATGNAVATMSAKVAPSGPWIATVPGAEYVVSVTWVACTPFTKRVSVEPFAVNWRVPEPESTGTTVETCVSTPATVFPMNAEYVVVGVGGVVTVRCWIVIGAQAASVAIERGRSSP